MAAWDFAAAACAWDVVVVVAVVVASGVDVAAVAFASSFEGSFGIACEGVPWVPSHYLGPFAFGQVPLVPSAFAFVAYAAALSFVVADAVVAGS